MSENIPNVLYEHQSSNGNYTYVKDQKSGASLYEMFILARDVIFAPGDWRRLSIWGDACCACHTCCYVGYILLLVDYYSSYRTDRVRRGFLEFKIKENLGTRRV